METLTSKHWTAESIEDFTFRIASDFLAQVETKIEAGEVTRTELAHRLSRTPGRVSQLLNNPGNLTVISAVRLVRAAGMKVALVAYDDNDPQNNNGPVNSEIFYRCWKHVGAPRTFFEFASTTASVGNCFDPYSVNSSNLAGASTVHASSCVFSFKANSPMVTVPENHDVNWGYIAYHKSTSGVTCDAANRDIVFDETPIGMKAATTAIKVTREPFIPLEA